MKLLPKKTAKKVLAIALGTLAGLATTGIYLAPAQAQATSNLRFMGLKANNTLVSFRLDRYNSNGVRVIRRVQVTGIDGNLQGVDFRPANGLLYGVTDKDKIYTIDPRTGVAKLVGSALKDPNGQPISFNGGFQSGFDFNPVLDRLRVIGSNDQNFSVNVDTATATMQTTLAYIAGDPNFGKDPNMTAAAYTNNMAGATSTQLYDIDYDLDVLVLQDPPNGTLTTVGPLGINFAPIGGFDIFTDAYGQNTGFAISGSTLYNINLKNGKAKKLGSFNGSFIGLAVTSKPL
ncbi:MAG: DUF4394 domain-containing protein [Cyanosarcina radialis HA8281-LM2]|jgi:hypothetical protein|nr:DUF4394 domain-containing protein [Cyanosarcina radialis HA8281-LM2]